MNLDQMGVLTDVVCAVLEQRGDLDPWVRCQILGGDPPQGPLQDLARKVAAHEEVTPDDIQSLVDRGVTEDAIFECIIAAAVGAGIERLDRGLAAAGAAR